jgi:hypothetical protein
MTKINPTFRRITKEEFVKRVFEFQEEETISFEPVFNIGTKWTQLDETPSTKKSTRW